MSDGPNSIAVTPSSSFRVATALHAFRSLSDAHTFTVLSRDPVAKNVPSWLHDPPQMMRMCALALNDINWYASPSLVSSKIAQARSRPTVKMRLSSGEKRIPVTVKLWAINGGQTSFQVSVDHNRIAACSGFAACNIQSTLTHHPYASR